MTEKREYIRSSDELPRFDPEPLLKIGLEILREADAPFVLIGRLAVWTYVPPAGQQFTKDVDFAVPYGSTEKIAGVARERGYEVNELSIGGIGIKTPEGSIDFIHRHPYLGELFADTLQVGQGQSKRVKSGGADVSVAPLGYLIAMKLVTHEPDDERDVEELLMTLAKEDYPGLQKLVLKHLGYGSVQYLDVLARRIGHPGPGMKSRYKDSGQDNAGKDVGEDA